MTANVPDVTPLTPRQRDVLAAIVALTGDAGRPPTLREIGEAVGISSPNGVSYCLRALARKGAVVYEFASQRDGDRSLARGVVVPRLRDAMRDEARRYLKELLT